MRSRATCHPDRPLEARGLCSACYSRDWRLAHLEQDAASHAKYRASAAGKARKRKYNRDVLAMKRYGITTAEFSSMMETQAGECAICKVDIRGTQPVASGAAYTRACIDHCHTTGKVRGLLCVCCNAGLGYYKNDAARLEAAAAYIRSHSDE